MKKAIKIRKAIDEDCDDLFNWRNDEESRFNSFNMEPIQYETHIDWFKNSLSNPNRIILIGINELNEKVGMVRFDINAPYKAEIYINIAPDKRGMGYGTMLIKKACKFLFKSYKVDKIVAKIKPENNKSITVFSKAGFINIQNSGIVIMELDVR